MVKSGGIVKELKAYKYRDEIFIPKWLLNKDQILKCIDKFEDDKYSRRLKTEEWNIFKVSTKTLFTYLNPIYAETYTDEKIFQDRDYLKIDTAWNFWKAGGEMLPVILTFHSDQKTFAFHVGKHRIVLCKFFNVPIIPMIILSNDEKLIPPNFINPLEIVDSLKNS